MKKVLIVLFLIALLEVGGCGSSTMSVNEKNSTSEKSELSQSTNSNTNHPEPSLQEESSKTLDPEVEKYIKLFKQKQEDGDYYYVVEHYNSAEIVKLKDKPGWDELERIIDDCIFKCAYNDTVNGYISTPNSAGGVSMALQIYNYDTETIKYITLEATPYNDVDDPVASSVGNYSTKKIKLTGPISDDEKVYETDPIWYNKTIKYVIISNLDIEFMDGTTESIKIKKKIEQSDFDYQLLLNYGIE